MHRSKVLLDGAAALLRLSATESGLVFVRVGWNVFLFVFFFLFFFKKKTTECTLILALLGFNGSV